MQTTIPHKTTLHLAHMATNNSILALFIGPERHNGKRRGCCESLLEIIPNECPGLAFCNDAQALQVAKTLQINSWRTLMRPALAPGIGMMMGEHHRHVRNFG